MYKDNYPLVSVAIITYNQRSFLLECINSVLDQDYPNFEIVVADDGSTDGSQEMLRNLSSNYPGKFALRLAGKNSGITPNSNSAHSACRGKYIAWMGGDDLMLPKKLSRQVAYMEENPNCVICYHDLEIFESPSQKKLGLISERATPRNGTAKQLIRHGCFMGACSVMVRASSAPTEGFDSRVPIASDWLYYIRTAQFGGYIHFLPSILGKYRRHARNVTNGTKFQVMENSSLQDHFISCGILLSEFPEYQREIRLRISDLLYSSRHCQGHTKDLAYVYAAFRIKFGFISLARLLFLLFRIRK